MRHSLLVLCAVACSNESTTATSLGSGSGAATTKRGSAGGFSASLSADLAKEGSAASDTRVAAAIDAGVTAKGDAAVAAAVIDAKPEPAGSAAQVAVGSGSAIKIDAGSAIKIADAKQPPEVVMTPEHHGPVKPSADLAAIKFELLPNWDRDIDEAGSIVLNVKIHGGTEPRTFTFHYGYDDPRAPADRDAYKKFLGDAKLLEVKTDRQRGAAWYLEGTDGNGRAAFRYLVNYGGKHLVCFGTLYKDADSNSLGDIRDEVVIQAKKICETLSL